MEQIYPAGPANVPAGLTRPTVAHRIRAWLTAGGLMLFLVAYLALTATFALIAYVLLAELDLENEPLNFVVGASAAFLALFLFKALCVIRRRRDSARGMELMSKLEPTLFAFLEQLAAEIRAPRPARVFLSANVTARVFYDLSLLNLLFPPRQQLEIGIGLVNALTLGELKAVLAHELGHSARGSMAAGRWVHVAQQIATDVIARRDVFDRLLVALANAEIRFAWIGWLPSILLWSARSLLETLFRWVMRAERALAREMKLQADRVAVSVAGSDALVHALHRLQGADAAWRHVMTFASAEARAGRGVADLCAVHTEVMRRLREILDDPYFARAAPTPAGDPAAHRVFDSLTDLPPCMWAAHPANSDREHNAKHIYVAAVPDGRAAWELFYDPATTCQQVSAQLLRGLELQPVSVAASLQAIARAYERPCYDRAYQGAYYSRALTRAAATAAELHDDAAQSPATLEAGLAQLYPESLAVQVQELRALEAAHAALLARREDSSGAVIRHRGRTLPRRELAAIIEVTQRELDAARSAVQAHDRQCRKLHLAAARQLGAGWEEYLKALLRMLHYAEHNVANVLDAARSLEHARSLSRGDGRISSLEWEHVMHAATELHNALRHVFDDEGRRLVLDEPLLGALGGVSWMTHLGSFTLPLPSSWNLDAWLRAVDPHVRHSLYCLDALREAALDHLLMAEACVARCVREKLLPAAAPAPPLVPNDYPTLVRGRERSRRQTLQWRERFHAGDSPGFALARVAAAGAIVAAILGFGFRSDARGDFLERVARSLAGERPAVVSVLNGLARDVRVLIGSGSLEVPAFAAVKYELTPGTRYQLRVLTTAGELIEVFEARPATAGKYVYNIAAASPLLQGSIEYRQALSKQLGHGSSAQAPSRSLGAPQWLRASTDYVLEDLPDSMKSQRRMEARTALFALAGASPDRVLVAVADEAKRLELLATHARWARSDVATGEAWLVLAAQHGLLYNIDARLREQPENTLLLKLEQDMAPQAKLHLVCDRHRRLAQMNLQSVDLQYLAARCIRESGTRRAALLSLYERTPRNGWLALEVGYLHAGAAEWNQAVLPLRTAMDVLPAHADQAAVDLGRVLRQRSGYGVAQLEGLAVRSPRLEYHVALEAGRSQTPLDAAYYAMSRGEIERAAQYARDFPGESQRLLRLVAASEGAPAWAVALAMALDPAEVVDDFAAGWAALGLARRERADESAHVRRLRATSAAETERILRFLAAMANPRQAEAALLGASPEARGYAYSTALIISKGRAPNEWRLGANQLLYASERPYFHPAVPSAAPVPASPQRTPPRLIR